VTSEEPQSVEKAGRDAIVRFIRALHPEVTTDGTTASAAFDPHPEHRGAPEWVHGGYLATVLDHFLARLASAALDSKVATGTLDLRYRQPVQLHGGPYTIRGSAKPPGHRTVKVHGEILGSDDQVLTEAHGLFVAVRRNDT